MSLMYPYLYCNVTNQTHFIFIPHRSSVWDSWTPHSWKICSRVSKTQSKHTQNIHTHTHTFAHTYTTTQLSLIISLVTHTQLYALPCMLVRPSPRHSHFLIAITFYITALAQPSTTGLSCIRLCLYSCHPFIPLPFLSLYLSPSSIFTSPLSPFVSLPSPVLSLFLFLLLIVKLGSSFAINKKGKASSRRASTFKTIVTSNHALEEHAPNARELRALQLRCYLLNLKWVNPFFDSWVTYKPMDGQTNGRTNQQTYKPTNRWTNQPTDRPTD